MSDKVISKEDIKNLIKEPNMYRVILLNDDYTTMEFVINVLMVVFHKSITEATLIMLDVHKKGKGIVGLYTYDIALTKINQVERMAAESGYPLKSIMERE
ncbi:MAG TPA: ATP-dependent Clp protease adaptor ClpS [Pseudobacteroides sp.]|uniref:ATP-dependent Clp protease adaptor ClpS n=1 Tax=Pseudobacteroides sp. TaxID=1968840 RepID=UPI002F950FBE